MISVQELQQPSTAERGQAAAEQEGLIGETACTKQEPAKATASPTSPTSWNQTFWYSVWILL